MPIPKAPQSGDYVSINDSDSDTGKDTEDDDRVIDHTANRETGLERQNEGFARSIRDLSLDQRQRRRSLMEEDGDALTLDVPPIEEQGEKEKPITWMSLPHKRQLVILVLARLSEPLVQSSLRSYLFYQLKSFDQNLPDSVIASQAGIMQGAFAAAQLCTAMLWGRWSDHGGRKRVLMVGLFGTMISCIGFGFSKKFYQALIFRMMAGALNGNVGVMRTMISEIVREKKYQSRAFLLLPMCGNVGVIIGPLLGGIMSDPAGTYPSILGGIKWLEMFPYSPPNLLSAIFLMSAVLTVFLGLEETHDSFSHKDDIGIRFGRRISSYFRRIVQKRSKPSLQGYQEIDGDEHEDISSPIEQVYTPVYKPQKRVPVRYKNRLPFRRIFTFNVISTLVSHGLLAGCMGTFQSIWYSFLSTPVYNPEKPYPPGYQPHLPFIFNGGIGLPPRSVGFAMAILGTIGITLQLFLYPIINARFGTVRSWRIFLYCFPMVYFLVPFLSLMPSSTPPPSQKTGFPMWAMLTALLFIQTIGRTFASPASAILINNCSPHPTVLGTIHGIGQSASSLARTVGPALGGLLYGLGLEKGCVGAAFWVLALMATGVCVASTFVKEGDGHEIRLDGDGEAEEEAEEANKRLI